MTRNSNLKVSSSDFKTGFAFQEKLIGGAAFYEANLLKFV